MDNDKTISFDMECVDPAKLADFFLAGVTPDQQFAFYKRAWDKSIDGPITEVGDASRVTYLGKGRLYFGSSFFSKGPRTARNVRRRAKGGGSSQRRPQYRNRAHMFLNVSSLTITAGDMKKMEWDK